MRVNSWREFQDATGAANKANAHKAVSPAWATMPERFSGLTLNGLRALSQANGDLELRTRAITALSHWMANGYVLSGRGNRKSSILLWSNERGVGKSGAVAALYSEWLRRGHSGAWIDFMEFVPLVRSTYTPGATLDRGTIVSVAQKAELLVVDEMGDVTRNGAETDHTRDVMNEIIRYRHAKSLPTMFTTNLAPGVLAEQFDVALAQRVLEMAVAVEMGGKCLRDLG
jgi:hypothetical protein